MKLAESPGAWEQVADEQEKKGHTMSYEIARKAFEEIKDSIKPPARDPIHWHYANGMAHLAMMIEADMQELRRQLNYIPSLLIPGRR